MPSEAHDARETTMENNAKMTAGGWVVIAVLIALLIAAILYAVDIWTTVDAQMSAWGWTMMIFGIVVTTGVGAGLMALVYYSANHDMDR
jgi:uncharacterized integral membrane protein